MRYELRDYQRDAASEILKRLGRARRDSREDGDRTSFALSAITGSGKTVIATAVIEALLYGSTDLGTERHPKVTFLWITDDPALNRQTKARMLDASELLNNWQLREVDEAFPDASLAPGHVYFLNTQKLSRTSRLAQGGTNAREFSFWDILRTTISAGETDLVLVLDEAHRGIKRTADRQTIVRRLIGGQPGSHPPMPIVWGISATIERFNRAMGEVTDRTMRPNVEVDIERVRASGLVKDEIGLDQPDEKGTFSTTLLREAVKTTRMYEERWARYSAAEGEPVVLPVLVVQVPDKASDAKLTEVVATIEEEWPQLGPRAVAHVFGEHQALSLGSRTVEWVYPESIQTDTDVRVVLAKEAISTGWDCPRAEVLYSERPAKDATHIAQIIGRMVRQPLAHRIATDDALNSVTCYLPLFNRTALTAIKDALEGTGPDNGQLRVVSAVVRNPAIFDRNPLLPSEVFDFVGTLPSVPTPDRSASPLRRARTLARLLADDASRVALMPNAAASLTERLNAKLDGLAVEHRGAVEANIEDLLAAEVRRSRITTVGEDTGGSEVRRIATHSRDVARDSQRIINSLPEGAGKTLNEWERRVVQAELARPGFVAWYRNPGSATPASLRIAYEHDDGDWASLQPDFIIVSRRTDGALGASIVDPHGDYLADARAKLQALAVFAGRFSDRFVRVESVAKVEDGTLRVLDFADAATRTAVLAFEGAKVTALYESGDSRPYDPR